MSHDLISTGFACLKFLQRPEVQRRDPENLLFFNTLTETLKKQNWFSRDPIQVKRANKSYCLKYYIVYTIVFQLNWFAKAKRAIYLFQR